MKYAEQRAAIETKFMAGWDSNTTPVKFENTVGLVKGSSAVQDETKLNEWCMLRIVNQSADNGAINGKMVRHYGAIFVTVFTKAGIGSNRGRVLADKVADVMAPVPTDVIIYYPAQMVASLPTPDASFHQVTMRIPFVVDQFM